MKRFLSIIIALILVLSLFAVNIVAFADDVTTPPTEESGSGSPDGDGGEGNGDEETKKEPHGPVEFVDSIFRTAVYDKHPFTIEMSEDFMLDIDWLYDVELVRSIFPGINYAIWPKEDVDEEGDDYELSFDLGEIDQSKYMGYYCEKDDQYYTSEELVEGKCPDCDGEVVWKIFKEYEDTDYKATKHFKLPNAPDAEEGFKFAGWELEYSDMPTWRQDKLYQADTEIAMPASNLKVKAKWVNEDETLDEDVPDDVIYVLYCSPQNDPRSEMEDWSRCVVTSTFSVVEEGLWLFRFAVVDGAEASKSDYSFDWDDVLATTYDNVTKKDGEVTRSEILTLVSYATDTTSPVVDLSTSMQNKHNDGLTVGTSYSISTSLDVEDASNDYSTSYVVYKMIGVGKEGADEEGWILIYDSKLSSGERVTEGYTNCISQSGTITPLASDVTGEYVYKIVYTVKDSFGNYAVKNEDKEIENEGFVDEYGYHPILLLKVNPKTVSTPKDSIEAWKIVLYVIAGLSAAGIVVLLVIKPKQETATDNRYNAKAVEGEAEANSEATEPTEDSNEQE